MGAVTFGIRLQQLPARERQNSIRRQKSIKGLLGPRSGVMRLAASAIGTTDRNATGLKPPCRARPEGLNIHTGGALKMVSTAKAGMGVFPTVFFFNRHFPVGHLSSKLPGLPGEPNGENANLFSVKLGALTSKG